MQRGLQRALGAAIAALIAHALAALADEVIGSRGAPVEIVGEPMHHIRLLNSSVRVYEAVIPAGEATLFHTHRVNGVGVDMTAVHLEIDKVGSAPQEFDTVAGDIWPANAAEPYTHRVTNRGTIPFRSIVVERLNSPQVGTQPPSPLWDSHYKLELENDLFRAYRITLKPGEATGDVALRPDTAIVAISGGQLVWRGAVESTSLKSIAPGDLRWIPASTRISMGNAGVTDFVAVVVELK
jgi:hypothetical protein